MFRGLRRPRNLDSTDSAGSESPPPPDTTAGTHPPGGSDLGGRDTLNDGEYARRCRELMRLLRQLRDLGADTVFDLPKIVVIGSQSAGKSSLIEAVTGVNVPRDSGTCTRCPMEFTMSSAATSWTCTISFRYHSNVASFGSLDRFGPVIRNKSEVELWLRRAQGAILSTDMNKAQWESKSADEIRRTVQAGIGMRQFTEDTIVVDIQDQDATDLSFVDLPGLIQNSNPESIDLIKNLAQQHIEGENTLILVTIPANDDIQNHGAVVLAKEADTTGQRTIVILTKPDLLGPGATGLHQFWKQTFENSPHNNPNYLQHGYYCVRLPDDLQRQQGHNAHNLPNPNFFDETRPWSEVTDRRRFGVNNVVRDVSGLLIRLIEANLPSLRTAVEAALRDCIDRLNQLPPPPQGETLTNIMLLINAFLRDLDAASVGDSHKALAQDCRVRYSELKEAILETCPKFGPNHGGDNGYNIQGVRRVITECTAWELPGFIPYDAYKHFMKEFVEEWDQPIRSCFDGVTEVLSVFLEGLSETHFGNYRGLKSFILSHVRAELERNKAGANAAVQKLLDLERQPFFTQRSDFSKKQEEWATFYRKEFFPYPRTQNDYWQNRDEIYVMATVRTYFQFAYERFVDTILLMQEHDLVQSLRPKLEISLLNKLIDIQRRPGGLESLFSEDRKIERQRRDLINKREKLIVIRETLNRFSMS